MTVLQTAGLSHSEIRGSRVICTYPRLIAAYRVLLRLREPRHPPCALFCLYLFEAHAIRRAHILSAPLFRPQLCGPALTFYKVRFVSCANMSKIFQINRRSTEERGNNQEPASFYTDNSLTGLQKGGVPAAPSGTATLLRLSPNHRFHPRPTLAVTDFRRPRLSWLDGRCVQGPGTYSPRHG